MNLKYLSTVSFALTMGAIGNAYADSIEAALLPGIEAATFEVVLHKPDNTSVSYEKPLPTDRLPFQFRSDKYFSVGTAFEIDKGHYITAFHVIEPAIGGLQGRPLIRDGEGRTYAIDKITRFSLQEDFVEFTVVNGPQVKPLPIDREPSLNETVYAVGNALGSGVVVRDGLYTSNTPEDESGRWKWLRFSAAASPGNSGGPLLDSKGRVIGVVEMKSPSENLNYALPIARVLDSSTELSHMDKRSDLSLSMMNAHETSQFRGKMPLPIDYTSFVRIFMKLKNAFLERQLGALMSNEQATVFPEGSGSQEILSTPPLLATFPTILSRSDDGIWERPSARTHRTTLDENGYVDEALQGINIVVHLRKPDNVPLATLYASPRRAMDMIIKGSPLSIHMAGERIKVTSLGNPVGRQVFTDRWQRHWALCTFAWPYLNQVVVAAMLPVPDGYIAIARFAPANDRYIHIITLQNLANFVDVSYDGSFPAWKEFLAGEVQLPDALRKVHLTIDQDRRFELSSPTISLRYHAELQPVTGQGELALAFAFVPHADGVRWQLGGLMAQPDLTKRDGFRVNLHPRPYPRLDQRFQSTWKGLLDHDYPQNGKPYMDNGMTWVGTTIDGDVGKKAGNPDHVYTMFYGVEGSLPDHVMEERLRQGLKGLSVH